MTDFAYVCITCGQSEKTLPKLVKHVCLSGRECHIKCYPVSRLRYENGRVVEIFSEGGRS